MRRPFLAVHGVVASESQRPSDAASGLAALWYRFQTNYYLLLLLLRLGLLPSGWGLELLEFELLEFDYLLVLVWTIV